MSKPMYRVAFVSMLVHSVTVYNTLFVSIAILARGSRIAQMLRTWKELQLFIASQKPETRKQRYLNFWLQICSLFAVSCMAGVFLWIVRFFVGMVMSEDKKRFVAGATGPCMVREITFIGKNKLKPRFNTSYHSGHQCISQWQLPPIQESLRHPHS